MKLARLAHDPGALVDFYEASLPHRGARCERRWFDRLEVAADGAAARRGMVEGEA
jgi:hypothetical protein